MSQVDKKESRIYFLLAIAWSMCPLRIDEALLVSLKDKCGVDIWNKLQKKCVLFFLYLSISLSLCLSRSLPLVVCLYLSPSTFCLSYFLSFPSVWF